MSCLLSTWHPPDILLGLAHEDPRRTPRGN
jgi:hypothetical protein